MGIYGIRLEKEFANISTWVKTRMFTDSTEKEVIETAERMSATLPGITFTVFHYNPTTEEETVIHKIQPVEVLSA